MFSALLGISGEPEGFPGSPAGRRLRCPWGARLQPWPGAAIPQPIAAWHGQTPVKDLEGAVVRALSRGPPPACSAGGRPAVRVSPLVQEQSEVWGPVQGEHSSWFTEECSSDAFYLGVIVSTIPSHAQKCPSWDDKFYVDHGCRKRSLPALSLGNQGPIVYPVVLSATVF